VITINAPLGAVPLVCCLGNYEDFPLQPTPYPLVDGFVGIDFLSRSQAIIAYLYDAEIRLAWLVKLKKGGVWVSKEFIPVCRTAQPYLTTPRIVLSKYKSATG